MYCTLVDIVKYRKRRKIDWWISLITIYSIILKRTINESAWFHLRINNGKVLRCNNLSLGCVKLEGVGVRRQHHLYDVMCVWNVLKMSATCPVAEFIAPKTSSRNGWARHKTLCIKSIWCLKWIECTSYWFHSINHWTLR